MFFVENWEMCEFLTRSVWTLLQHWHKAKQQREKCLTAEKQLTTYLSLTWRSFGLGAVEWLTADCSKLKAEGFIWKVPCHQTLSTRGTWRTLGGKLTVPSGNVDKGVFTSFLNAKNVFPVVALLGLVLRSVLNRQGTRISHISQFSTKKTTTS